MKVTFDSNVWEALFCEQPAYPKIMEKIANGAVSPYLCQISISIESIPKSAPHEFFTKYASSVSFTGQTGTDGKIHGKLQIGPNNASHPGLPPILLQRLLKARDMGFKVIRMTNFATVRSPEVPQEMFVTIETTDAFWAYAQRLSECSEFITSLGCSSHHWDTIKRSKQKVPPMKAARAVAEWVDGDALSAHYAFGADVFCTNDRAGKAGAGSIFYPSNVEKLKDRFGITVLSPEELIQQI